MNRAAGLSLQGYAADRARLCHSPAAATSLLRHPPAILSFALIFAQSALLLVPKYATLLNGRQVVTHACVGSGSLQLFRSSEKGKKETAGLLGARHHNLNPDLWRLNRVHAALKPRKICEKHLGFTVNLCD